MGASYARDEPLPESLELAQGDTLTLTVPHVFNEFTAATLSQVKLRQATLNSLSFVTITEETDQSVVSIDSEGVSLGSYDLYLESYDVDIGTEHILMTDVIRLSIIENNNSDPVTSEIYLDNQFLTATESQSWVLPDTFDQGGLLQDITLEPDP